MVLIIQESGYFICITGVILFASNLGFFSGIEVIESS